MPTFGHSGSDRWLGEDRRLGADCRTLAVALIVILMHVADADGASLGDSQIRVQNRLNQATCKAHE